MFRRKEYFKKDGLEIEVNNAAPKLVIKIHEYILETILILIILSPVILVILSFFTQLSLYVEYGAVLLSLIPAAVAYHSGFIVSKRIQIKRYIVSDNKVPAPIKAVFLSDIGVGNAVYSNTRKDLMRIVDTVNSLSPDIIFIGGDFIDYWEDEIPLLEPLSSLQASLGIYGVLGNHDYVHVNRQLNKAGPPWKLINFLKKRNIKILQNEGVHIKIHGRSVFLAGVTDIQNAQFDHKEALKTKKEDEYAILLSHNPDIVDWLRKKDNVDLVLSGHIHAGQVKLPIIGPLSVPTTRVGRKLNYGLYTLNKCKLIVSSGAGLSGTRVRFGTSTEIVEIELRPS